MKRSKRLKPIAGLAAHREMEASRQLADTHAQLLRQEQLLGELVAYHAEYTAANVMSHVASADPVRLQDYRLFIERLERAIRRQRETIRRLRTRFDENHDQWSDSRSHRKALENVTERFARAEILAENRAEQNHIEEVSSLLRTRAGNGTRTD